MSAYEKAILAQKVFFSRFLLELYGYHYYLIYLKVLLRSI